MSKKRSAGKSSGGAFAKETKSKVKKKSNPFERRFGSEKHKVLNRKSKTDDFKGVKKTKNGVTAVGKPGVARSKALDKRKATLLKEYKLKDKANVFLDRRIGEGDATVSLEEKMVARFAAEERRRNKKNLFQLGEEEETLTHFGRNIAEIDRFDDPREDVDGDDAEEKKLDAKFVSEAHFGGFMSQNDIEFAQGKTNTRKDWIETMIADSKKRKAEKAKDLEEAETMTKDLNEKWKGMFGELRTQGQVYTKNELKEQSKETDSYDILMRELGFEKGKKEARDRLKTDEEVIKEEKDKLEKLEADRMKRMRGELEEENEESEGEEEDESEDEEDEDDDDDEEEKDDEDEDEEDDNEDLDESESEEEEEERKKKTNKKSKKKMKQEIPPELRAKIMEAAQAEIPFTFKVPESFEELQSHLQDLPPSRHSTVVTRMIKCNHPQFGNGNREKLQSLFAFLLQHVHDLAADFDAEDAECAGCLGAVDELFPLLYDLAQFSPAPSAKAVLSVLQEKYEEFCKQPRGGISFEGLIFLRLTLLLFPSSDYRHPVVTPAFQFMSHALQATRFNSRRTLAAGALVAAMFTEGLSLSKRYSPELLNFLSGVVFVSFPKALDRVTHKCVPPFKVVGPEAQLLCDKVKKSAKPSKLKWSDAKADDDEPLDGPFASSLLGASLDLLLVLADLWGDKAAAKEAFADLEAKHLDQLGRVEMHAELRAKVERLRKRLGEISTKKGVISRERAKPKILKLYEPEIEDNFDPFVKKRVGSKEKLEMSKLLHKMKRERKGAKKDIRADTAFLATQKAKEAREKDLERQRKTKELLAGLGNQEGDYRKMQRKKKKM